MIARKIIELAQIGVLVRVRLMQMTLEALTENRPGGLGSGN
jgi:hypothetical protein